MKERELWLPILSEKEKIIKKDYDCELTVSLIDSSFELPKEILDVYSNRNGDNDINFYLYPLSEEDPQEKGRNFKFIGLYDPLTRKIINLESLRRNTALIINLNEDKKIEIPDDYMSYLNLTDQITVVGNDELVELWNPLKYIEFDKTGERGFDHLAYDNLSDAQRAVYQPFKTHRL